MAKAVHKRKHLIWLQFEQVRVHDVKQRHDSRVEQRVPMRIHKQKAEEAGNKISKPNPQ